MEAVFLKLLNMSITAGWLVLAVVVLRLVLKKAPRAIICALWALVALRLICPFSVESMFSLIPDPEPIQTQVVHEPQMTHSPEFLAGAILEEATASVGSAPKAEPAAILPVVSNIWPAGMAVMVLYAAVSYILLLRRTREGVEQQKGVWLCDRIGSPFILGIIKPRIFLPSSINPADEEFVLAHERAHLKRLDHLWKPLGFFLLTVYWFNPLLWLAYILLCRDIELACDEKVLRQLGTGCKQDYSTALINCSVPRRMISACPLAFGEVGVKKRIKSILNYKKPAFWIILVALIASIAVAVCFLTNPEKEQEEKLVSYIIPTTAFNRILNDIPNESDHDPSFVDYGVLYANKQKLNISSMCRKQDKSLKEVICISGNDVYFVYAASGDWIIASINLQTKAWTDHYKFTHARKIYYTLQHDCAYSERNGFYYDGQIYLNDFESVLIYDISSGQTCMKDYSSVAFPQLPAVYSESLGEHTFKLHIDDDTYSFELNDVAQNSNGISVLNALKDKVIWDGKTSCLHNFFKGLDIQVIGDRIYALEPVLNFYGETYAVILEYNVDTGMWLYIGAYHTGDTISQNSYIIPEDK